MSKVSKEREKNSPPCPACGGRGAHKNGLTARGLQRWRCPACGHRWKSKESRPNTIAQPKRQPYGKRGRSFSFKLPLGLDTAVRAAIAAEGLTPTQFWERLAADWAARR